MDAATLFSTPDAILSRMDAVWTYFLLITRFTSFFMLIPGIGQGASGLPVRLPAILALSAVSMVRNEFAALPNDPAMMCVQVISELIIGGVTSMIPLLVVGGAQMAGQLATSAMGMSGAQMFDPVMNVQVSDIARLYGDLSVALFLMLGGHYVAIYTLSGANEAFVPGSFLLTADSISVLVDRSAAIFRIGVLLSAPVIVALLLTNFLMGILSKVVSSVNIFIVSFPLTIGIGLILSILALPELFSFMRHEFNTMEGDWAVLVHDTRPSSSTANTPIPSGIGP